MESEKPLKTEIEYDFVTRKIRILGIAIMVGLALIFAMGLFVAANNINKELGFLNHISVIICVFLCFGSFYIKKFMLKKVTKENFIKSYFNAHVVPFALCDFAGLFCITTSLFINFNLIYAAAGLFFSLLYVIANFPQRKDLEIIFNN